MGMVKKYECPECGKPCDAIECDSGIGPGEAWGAKFVDKDEYMGSDCCEAELEDAEWPEYEDERADWLHDQMVDRKLEERWEKEHG